LRHKDRTEVIILLIRRFVDNDAEQISELIGRNFIEVNSKDYSLDEMIKKSKEFSPEKVRHRAKNGHMYVVCERGTVIGTGTISDYWGSTKESILLTIFVTPEYQGREIGRKIIETLEADEFFIRAKRVEVCASITACGFYEKCGYKYKDGVKILDKEGHYRIEKYNPMIRGE